MDIEQHRFSQNEIDSYCLPLQNDLISIFGILEDAAADLLDQAVKNGWTPDQYIDELNKLIDESSAPQETTVVPELQEIKVNKAYKLDGRMTLQDMPISVENTTGSTRSGIDTDGHPWSITMMRPYGYIRGTKGVDGDAVDVYVGDNPESQLVFVIHIKQPNGKYDEDKCMIGFNSEQEARKCLEEHYDRDIIKSIETLNLKDFKNKLESNQGKKITATRVRKSYGDGSTKNCIHNKYGYCCYDMRIPVTIYGLYIYPKYRNKGHAKELLQLVINDIKSKGYTDKINVEARPMENSISYEDLVKFYEKMNLNVINKSMEDNMPVSKPKSGEKEQDYVSRVIGELIGAGKPKDQAAAIAHSAYRNNVQKARSVGGFESPEPGDIPEKDKKLLADVYAKYRKTGMSKEDSAKRAWGAVHNATKSKISKDAGNGIIDPEQLRIGTMEEMKEHRVTLQEGMRIAIDHLREIPDYYTRMRKCGL